MCHYVTATLPRDVDVSALDAIARRHGRQFAPLENTSIVAQVGPGQAYFLTTTGHCDCGTALGYARPSTRRTPDRDAQMARFEKRGWSQAKIARAMAQKQEAAQSPRRHAEATTAADLNRWQAFITAVLESGLTQELGLLLHFYDGGLDGTVTLADITSCRLAELDVHRLGHMAEDILYRIRR